VLGAAKQIAAFGDNASINKCKLVSEACRMEEANIMQIQNIPYRPDLLGINQLWRQALSACKDEMRRSNQCKNSGMEVVRGILSGFNERTMKDIAKMGWQTLMSSGPVLPGAVSQKRIH